MDLVDIKAIPLAPTMSGADIYNALTVLQDAIEGMFARGPILGEHAEDGRHQLSIGLHAARPVVGMVDGQVYFSRDVPMISIYSDTLVAWVEMDCDKASAKITYTNPSFTAVDVDGMLDYILARFHPQATATAIDAAEVDFIFGAAKPYIGASGDVETALGLLADEVASISNEANYTVSYGPTITQLSLALDDIFTNIRNIMIETGDTQVGFDGTGFLFPLSNDGDVHSALDSLANSGCDCIRYDGGNLKAKLDALRVSHATVGLLAGDVVALINAGYIQQDMVSPVNGFIKNCTAWRDPAFVANEYVYTFQNVTQATAIVITLPAAGAEFDQDAVTNLAISVGDRLSIYWTETVASGVARNVSATAMIVESN